MEKAQEDTSEVELTGVNIMDTCNVRSIDTFKSVTKLYSVIVEGYSDLKRKKIKKVVHSVKELNDEINNQRNRIHYTIQKLKEDDVETGHHYVQVLDYMRELGNCLTHIVGPVFEYIDNNHPPLIDVQQKELSEFVTMISDFFNSSLKLLSEHDFDNIDKITKKEKQIISHIDKLRKQQIKRIKRQDAGTKNSLLYLRFLNETKNLILHAVNLVKAQKHFLVYNMNNGNLESKETVVESSAER